MAIPQLTIARTDLSMQQKGTRPNRSSPPPSDPTEAVLAYDRKAPKLSA